MREQLRRVPDLARTYPKPHDHRLYGWSHEARVQVTIALGVTFGERAQWQTVADLSCGNAAIPEGLALGLDLAAPPILGDYAPGYPITGPIEDTIHQLYVEHGAVDVFVCSETLEHLADPVGVLTTLRVGARHLLYSTPVHDEGETDSNGEHVWQWDRDGVLTLLAASGWTPATDLVLDPRDGPYRYMIGVAA